MLVPSKHLLLHHPLDRRGLAGSLPCRSRVERSPLRLFSCCGVQMEKKLIRNSKRNRCIGPRSPPPGRSTIISKRCREEPALLRALALPVPLALRRYWRRAISPLLRLEGTLPLGNRTKGRGVCSGGAGVALEASCAADLSLPKTAIDGRLACQSQTRPQCVPRRLATSAACFVSFWPAHWGRARVELGLRGCEDARTDGLIRHIAFAS